MNSFTYSSASTAEQALQQRSQHKSSSYLGGGTNLLDNWKLSVEQPGHLVDVRHAGLNRIETTANGLRIGAGATNTDIAYNEHVKAHYPVLSEAILAGASPQLRNAATAAGNLLQRTRCYYFRDAARPCNKRVPGSGCAAIDGIHRTHAIFGTSEKCIATHPSDMDVALMTLDAVVRTRGAGGERTIPIDKFYVAFGDDPAKENVLEPGELVLSIDLPATAWFANSRYVKARDRASYEFALASAAVALRVENGRVADCRIALGGVGTKPWRALQAEQSLRGQTPDRAAFEAAAEAELQAAQPRTQNAFKIPLSKRVMAHSLQLVAEKLA